MLIYHLAADGRRAELRAVAADLRYTGGYLLHVIRRSAIDCSLDEPAERLARFAGKNLRRAGTSL